MMILTLLFAYMSFYKYCPAGGAVYVIAIGAGGLGFDSLVVKSSKLRC